MTHYLQTSLTNYSGVKKKDGIDNQALKWVD